MNDVLSTTCKATRESLVVPFGQCVKTFRCYGVVKRSRHRWFAFRTTGYQASMIAEWRSVACLATAFLFCHSVSAGDSQVFIWDEINAASLVHSSLLSS